MFIDQKYQNARNAMNVVHHQVHKNIKQESGGFHNHSSPLTMVLGYKPMLKVTFFVPKAKFYIVSPQSVRDSYVNFFLFFVLDESS